MIDNAIPTIDLCSTTHFSLSETGCLIILCSPKDLKRQLLQLDQYIENQSVRELQNKKTKATEVKPSLAQLVESDKFNADFNHSLLINAWPNTQLTHILFWGLGEDFLSLSSFQLNKTLHALFKRINDCHISRIHLLFNEQREDTFSHFCRCFYSNQYRFSNFKSQSETIDTHTLSSLMMWVENPLQYSHTLEIMVAEQKGLQLTKDLANSPSNICTPDMLAQSALSLEHQYAQVSTQIISQHELEKEGMGAYLAVNRASSYEASLPIIRYNGCSDSATSSSSPPIVFIGKGVTFDTGGISLKQAV